MRRTFIHSIAFLSLLFFLACNNNKEKTDKTVKTDTGQMNNNNVTDNGKTSLDPDMKKTAAAIARQWCDLNTKAEKAGDAEMAAAEKALEDFENEMEKKYGNNDALMEEIEKEAEKCENESRSN